MHSPHMTILNLFGVHRYVDLMQSWKLRSQENLLVCFDVVRKAKSSITSSDRGRNGVHDTKIPWSLSAAPLGQGNRYRNDKGRLIVRQFQWKDLDHDFRVFIVKKMKTALCHLLVMHSSAALQMNVIIGSWTVTRFIIHIVPSVSVEGCLKGKLIPSGLPMN